MKNDQSLKKRRKKSKYKIKDQNIDLEPDMNVISDKENTTNIIDV